MIDFPALLAVANRAWTNSTEPNIEAFLQYVNNQPEPDTVLENAMIEAVCDLTMHEYLCHNHEEADHA